MASVGRRSWMSAQTISGCIGVVLLSHALYGFATVEPSRCHFCPIAPGAALPVLEVGFGVPLATLAVAVFSAERYDPTVGLTRPARNFVLAGSILSLGGMAFVAITRGFGITVGGPVILVGYLVIVLGFVLAVLEYVMG